jgi:hypothetical protein
MWPFKRKPADPPVELLFVILDGGKAIKCMACGMTSHHPRDVEQRYCGNCKKFHGKEGGCV